MKPKYNTKATRIHHDYQGDSRHKSDYEMGDDILSADSIEELYEAAAEYNEKFLASREICCKGRFDFVENYRVDFSEIYIVVSEFSDEMLKATKAYSERTAIRDAVIAADKAERELKAAATAEWERKQKEKWELEEFYRLSRKFAR